MVSNVNLIWWCQEIINQKLSIGLSAVGKLLMSHQIFASNDPYISLHIAEVYEIRFLLLIIRMQMSNLVWNKKLLNGVFFMEGVHLPKRLDRASGCHHELFSATRVDFEKLCDIVYAIFIRDPNSVLNSSVLLDIFASICRQIFNLIFCSMNQLRGENQIVDLCILGLRLCNLVLHEKSTKRVEPLPQI